MSRNPAFDVVLELKSAALIAAGADEAHISQAQTPHTEPDRAEAISNGGPRPRP